MLSQIQSASLSGIEALSVQVEVNTDLEGEPKPMIVGLPDASVRESQERVNSAIVNSGYKMPYSKTIINLAPGDLRKEGPSFDLPIALGILAATDQLPEESINGYLFAGELALSGELRPVKGGLPMAILAQRSGLKGLILPEISAREAALVSSLPVYGMRSLDQVRRFLTGDLKMAPVNGQAILEEIQDQQRYEVDFADIKGQQAAKRAVEIAVAGGHNILLIGPPGSGKSMLAKRIPTIMPEPTLEEYLEILSIHSVAGLSQKAGTLEMVRPYRNPHHTISDVGLLGGGTVPGPGEISLAHNGVLFLDELPEFRRSTLEVLRQPLEDGSVTISRSKAKVTLPCSFMLVAAMNPTPDGYDESSGREIRSTPAQIQRYRSRISGPLLDRIDIHVDVPALSISELRNEKSGEDSAIIRQRIQNARAVQLARFRGSRIYSNAQMGQQALRNHCEIQPGDAQLLEHAMEELKLSARAYDRILKVARTIADLAGSEQISKIHLMEAIQYRSLDRAVFY